MTDDERTEEEEEEEEEEEGLFSFAFQNIYVLFVVTKSRAIFIQRRKNSRARQNLKTRHFHKSQNQKTGRGRFRQLPKITMDKF